jgi:tRNA(Ile)-lysidine synthase
VGTLPGEESVAFELERLRTLDLPTRRRLLRASAERMGVRLGSAETLRLLQLAGLAPADALPDPTVPSRPGSRLDFAGGLRAERSLRELRLSRIS